MMPCRSWNKHSNQSPSSFLGESNTQEEMLHLIRAHLHSDGVTMAADANGSLDRNLKKNNNYLLV